MEQVHSDIKEGVKRTKQESKSHNKGPAFKIKQEVTERRIENKLTETGMKWRRGKTSAKQELRDKI